MALPLLDDAAYGRALFSKARARSLEQEVAHQVEGAQPFLAFTDLASWGPLLLVAAATEGPLTFAMQQALAFGGVLTMLRAGASLNAMQRAEVALTRRRGERIYPSRRTSR